MLPEALNAQKEKLRGQLRKMQDQVKEAFLKLQRSSIFSAEMFVKVQIYKVNGQDVTRNSVHLITIQISPYYEEGVENTMRSRVSLTLKISVVCTLDEKLSRVVDLLN